MNREQKATSNAPIWPAKDWWTNYRDPQLTALMGQAEANNLDMAQAAARVRQLATPELAAWAHGGWRGRPA